MAFEQQLIVSSALENRRKLPDHEERTGSATDLCEPSESDRRSSAHMLPGLDGVSDHRTGSDEKYSDINLRTESWKKRTEQDRKNAKAKNVAKMKNNKKGAETL